ncbi:hypothetical protein ACSIGC_06840 [Tenacibaculum sp. ZS6-P6]|uniref:hypothetical protein n=1 Tax=Tenacibaculum sp. ZS6-P6 TaxID=3447503 RepID=UPI003F99C297
MFKKTIIEKIESFGGIISNPKSKNIEDFTLSIKLDNELFYRPEYFPWSAIESKSANYFIDNECCGQLKWVGNLFTPMNEFTKDYEQMYWSDSFDEECLKEVINATGNHIQTL